MQGTSPTYKEPIVYTSHQFIPFLEVTFFGIALERERSLNPFRPSVFDGGTEMAFELIVRL